MKKGLFFMALVILLSFPAVGLAAGRISILPKLSVYTDDKNVALSSPEGLACNDKEVVAADTGNGRLVSFQYDDSGVKLVVPIKLPQIASPTRVQIDAKGDIFVLDSKLKKVARVEPSGAFGGYIEPQGLPADFGSINPVSFKLDSAGNIYLVDNTSQSVIVLDQAGKFQKKIDFPKGVGFIPDLCIDPQGTVYIVDAMNCIVYSAPQGKTFSPFTGSMKDYMNFPISITMGAKGYFYIVDEHGAGVIILGPDGSFQGRQLSLGWSEGMLYYPVQMCISSTGYAFIADRGNNRIGIFSVVR
jgi:DNA-binding beta-propeller fold protein YncE